MFFRRSSGQGLKPVRVVRCPLLDRPLFHRLRDLISDERVQFSSLIHRLVKLTVNIFRKTVSHDTVRKNILAVDIRNVETLFH